MFSFAKIIVFVLSLSGVAFADARPIQVKMYNQPLRGEVVNPTCDVFWAASFKKAKSGAYHGVLSHTMEAGSSCEIVVPNVQYKLVFFTHPAKDDCGTATANFGAVKFVDGKMELDAKGQPVVYEGSFEDNSERTCENVIAALIVVTLDLDQSGLSKKNFVLYSNP